MRFQCYEAIGVAIGEAGNVAAADHLIEDVLSWRFQYPEIQGATDEWETVVNPFHLPKIRCWMHIIESNPALYERLAAALNVQLRLGGVYIADTDLFQRDVTRFLNADIRPHLLRGQAAATGLSRLLQRCGRRGRAARGLHRDRRDLRPARHPDALRAQAVARRVVQPLGGLQPCSALRTGSLWTLPGWNLICPPTPWTPCAASANGPRSRTTCSWDCGRRSGMEGRRTMGPQRLG